MANAIATIQAAEVGKQINFTQNSNGPSFTGATCKLIVTNPSGKTNSYDCSIDPTDKFPLLVTTGLEFPTAGKYQIQLKYLLNGEVYFSPVQTISVLPNLA